MIKIIIRDLLTVGDVWENVVEQTKMNNKWISEKERKKFDSYSVLRIGLFQLKYMKVE